MRRLLIIGCGDVMRRTLPQLVRRWRVLALVRRRDPQLAALGVTQIEGDLDHPANLARLAGIADAVIHSAPPPAQGSGDPRTRNLLAAAATRKKSTTAPGLHQHQRRLWRLRRRAGQRDARPGGKVGAGGTARGCRTRLRRFGRQADAIAASASCARRASMPATGCRWSGCTKNCR
jgi:hypothetical protein